MESYILAYTTDGTTTNLTDKYEVFCDYQELNEVKARERLKEIINNFGSSLYSWNICKIIETSEHYETEK